jgi:hypothetical protein
MYSQAKFQNLKHESDTAFAQSWPGGTQFSNRSYPSWYVFEVRACRTESEPIQSVCYNLELDE